MRSRLSAVVASLPRAYWLLWLGTLINRLGSFVIPFLTLYLTQRRGLPIGQAALMVSLFGAGSFSAALIGGELADRLGRRPVMLLSFLLAPFNMIALGLVQPLALLALLTFTQGLLTDLYRPAVSAAIADLVPAEERPRAYGYLYWAINLGFAIAPVVAGLIARPRLLPAVRRRRRHDLRLRLDHPGRCARDAPSRSPCRLQGAVAPKDRPAAQLAADAAVLRAGAGLWDHLHAGQRHAAGGHGVARIGPGEVRAGDRR